MRRNARIDSQNTATDEGGATESGQRLAFVVVVVAVYALVIFWMKGLNFDLVKDEVQFWELVLAFVETWPPSLEELRNYPEPMTPVSFLIRAGLEHWHHQGLAAARLVSMVAAFAILGLIGLQRTTAQSQPGTPMLAAMALLIYPYWIPISLLVYTDVPASLFIVLGFFFYVRKVHLAAAIFLAVAIGTRQYSVAFPAAITAYEGLQVLRTRKPSWSSWLPYALAAASLLGWITFFGGMGPAAGLERWPRHAESITKITPDFSIYFLAAIGAYFVLPEFLIDRRWRNIALRPTPRVWITIALVFLVFLTFTPRYSEGIGPLHRTLTFILGGNELAAFVRLSVLLALVCGTVLRFAQLDIGAWIVIVNAGLMAFSWSPWEKYCMPVLAALWFLKAAGRLRQPT